MFERVLVPLDGSMLAESALEPALHLAEKTGGMVYLMRVPVYMDSGAQTSPEYHRVWTADNPIPEYEDTTAYLRETRERIARPRVSVRIIVGEGDRANAIINTAHERNVDLIVMASHARKGVSRWLLGSVSGKIIREAPSPVMLVRQPHEYSHILVTLDGSQLAEKILEPAVALAAGFDSRITILQVDDELATSLNEVSDKPPLGSYLDQVVSRYEDRGIDVRAAIGKGSVAKTIMSFAGDNGADIVAMSTNGRSGLRKVIFGSVTEKVMRDCGSAMLIVRPTEEDLS